MDAIALLKADHRKVEALFKKIEELGDSAHVSRGRLFDEVNRELSAHAEVEEQIFYPAVKEKAKRKSDARDEVLEAYEEHANVKAMLAKLEALPSDDETYAAKLQVLMELVKHHVKEEETELFKESRQLLDAAELQELGSEMAAAKERLVQAAV